MTDNATVAKRFARQRWGHINSQHKFDDGIWWFDCAGHGGYIVDTEAADLPENIAEKFEGTVLIRKNSRKYRPEEQHFAEFEEDSNWAVLEYLRPDIMRAMERKKWEDWAEHGNTDEKLHQKGKRLINDEEAMEERFQERRQSIIESLKRWQDDEILEELGVK